jgi:hypothetical protein
MNMLFNCTYLKARITFRVYEKRNLNSNCHVFAMFSAQCGFPFFFENYFYVWLDTGTFNSQI